jgi:hypothetical protein
VPVSNPPGIFSPQHDRYEAAASQALIPERKFFNIEDANNSQ